MFGDWKLSYLGTEYVFGPPGRPVRLDRWEQSPDQLRVQDVLDPEGDTVWFGEDLAEAGEITIHVTINCAGGDLPPRSRALQALEVRAELYRVWTAVAVRSKANVLAELTMGGRVVVEGRPRRPRFDDTAQSSGVIRAELPFVPARPESYLIDEAGASWREAEVQIVAPQPKTGWTFPIEFPVQNLDPVVRATWFETLGTSDAACVASLFGPIQAGAELELADGFRLRTNRALAYDQVAVADARPGRTLLTVNGAPENFLAPSSSKLSELILPPGPHQLSLRGVSPQGTARALLRWRDTKAGI